MNFLELKEQMTTNWLAKATGSVVSVWRLEVQYQGVTKGMLSSKAPGKDARCVFLAVRPACNPWHSLA